MKENAVVFMPVRQYHDYNISTKKRKQTPFYFGLYIKKVGEIDMEKRVVTIGTVGAGYAAYLHGNGYEKVSGVTVRLKTVCDLNLELARKVQERYGYEQVVQDYREMLADPEIDVIDIVLPPFLRGN